MTVTSETETDLDRQVESVRRFNRFYTRQIGVLDEGMLASPYSLTEVRVLYELAHRDQPTASEVARELGLDAGYLSRILRGFQRRGLADSTPSEADGRQNLLCLTAQGRETFDTLDARAREAIGAMLGRLPAPDQRRLVAAMQAVEAVLGDGADSAEPYLLRPHRAGDMGWIVHRHGVLYAREYGFDERFEALVAEIVAKFIREYDPEHERCWIAERDGEIVGSVCVVKESKQLARLRLLLVEPKARGLGVGRRLVGECIRFARRTGYDKLTLSTDAELHAARHLYEDAGFRLVHEERHRSWGPESIFQTWELDL
jgi:DNA-binding MarR family transcriptional regulator/GNAT superfamily N-acetyltransferase